MGVAGGVTSRRPGAARGLARRPDLATAALAAVGALGAALVARSSYVVGTVPGHHLDLAHATGPWRWPYEVGITLLVAAWLALGRLVLDPAVEGMTRRVCWAGAVTALPLLLSAPVMSQDVWAYLGQGNVAAHGLNPYAVGPGAVPGRLADGVSAPWVHAPSSYGPLWTATSRVVVQAVGEHPWAGLYVLRALAVVALVASGWALARLCRATGAQPAVGLWLALTGPFTLVMLVVAVHNDALMIALLLAGVTAAATVRHRWRALLLAAALVGLAASVKANALVVTPLLPLVWHRYADRSPEPVPGGRWLREAAVSVAAGAGVLVLSGVVLGLDLGWVSHVGDGRVGIDWLSASQLVGSVAHLVAPTHVPWHRAQRWPLVHPVGLALAAVGVAAVVLTARRRPPLRSMAWAMLVLVVSSPAPRLWYLLWPLVFLAAERLPRPMLLVAGCGPLAVLAWYPPGVAPGVSEWVLLGAFAVLLAAAAWLLRDVPEPAPPP